MRRVLLITLALFAIVFVVASIRYTTPTPVSRDAPRDVFSAERAREVHQRLVGDGATRHVGTDGNARARGVIIAELEKIGWTVEMQHTMSCTYHGLCAPITNVVARLPGREPSLPGVLIIAHYDSVPVSPGASDDGVGTTTVLETARALAEGTRPRRTIVALLDDGEEAGLLGADAFVRFNPIARTIDRAVNVDARGSHGASQMFETSGGNAWLIALVASHVDRPVTTSLFYEVYKRMPNDTDFTATKTIASGVNFANTAGIEHYHTPLDTLDVADLGTLQHHGDHVLGMTRALAEDAVAHRSRANGGGGGEGDVVWFDVLAFGIVRYPESWALLLALIALALVVGQVIRARSFDRGLAVFFASLVPGVLVALGIGLLLRAAGAIPAPWVAHPFAGTLSLHAGAVAATLGIALALASRSTPRALWAGTWIGWGIVGVVTAAFVPGMSYLFVVPTIAASLTGSLPLGVACATPAAVAATLVLALQTALYDALGFAVPPLIVLPTVLLGTTLAPMLSGLSPAVAKRLPLALGAIAIVFGVVALIVPKFSASIPQRVNVVLRQDDRADHARVFIDTTWGPATWGTPPNAMFAAIGQPAGKEPALPWTLPTPFADVPPMDAKPPLAEILEARDDGSARRHVRARVRSQRGASTIALFFPVGRRVDVTLEDVVGGRRSAVPRPVTNGTVVGLLSVPTEGIVVDLDAVGAGPIQLTLLDRSYGLPTGTKAEAAALARPKEATTFQDGDVTVMTKSLLL